MNIFSERAERIVGDISFHRDNSLEKNLAMGPEMLRASSKFFCTVALPQGTQSGVFLYLVVSSRRAHGRQQLGLPGQQCGDEPGDVGQDAQGPSRRNVLL
jgi:hypothetical protein